MKETYFKYRSLNDIKRFLQILIYSELYGAKYNELNDPMEGYFNYSPQIDLATRKEMYSKRAKTFICSVSKKHNIGVMWSHYADEHRGCCIEFEVTSKWDKIEVEYLDEMPELDTNSQIGDILKCKSKQWEYEKEVRFIKTVEKEDARRPKLKIKIKKIWLGARVDRNTISLINRLVEKLYPKPGVNKDNKNDNIKGNKEVKVEKIQYDQINFGYNR